MIQVHCICFRTPLSRLGTVVSWKQGDRKAVLGGAALVEGCPSRGRCGFVGAWTVANDCNMLFWNHEGDAGFRLPCFGSLRVSHIQYGCSVFAPAPQQKSVPSGFPLKPPNKYPQKGEPPTLSCSSESEAVLRVALGPRKSMKLKVSPLFDG